MAERLKCAVCGRQYYDSVIGKCPKEPEKAICMYCCRKICRESYRADGMIGQGCRGFDPKKRKDGKGGNKA